MIAANNPPSPEEPSDNAGPGTTGDNQVQTRADMRLYARAIKHHWPVTRRTRKKLCTEAAAALDCPDTFIEAARLLIAADGVNVRREANDITAAKQPDTTNVNVAFGVSVEQAQADPEYIEYLRQQRLASRGKPSALCGNGNGGPVDDGGPPVDPGPGDNGHANGNGRH